MTSHLISSSSLANLANWSCKACTLIEPIFAFNCWVPAAAYWSVLAPRNMSLIPVTWYKSSIVWSLILIKICRVPTTSCTGNQSIWPFKPPFSANIAQLSTGIRSFSVPSLSIRPTLSPAFLSYTPTTLTARVIIATRDCNSSISLYRS